MTGPLPGLTTTVADLVTVVGLLARVTVGLAPTLPVTFTLFSAADAVLLLAVALLSVVGSALAQPATSTAGRAMAASRRGRTRRTTKPLVVEQGRFSLTRQPVRPRRPCPAGLVRQPIRSLLRSRLRSASHAGDQPLHPLVDAGERVLAEHRALSLVVQLQVHPVDGEVAPLLLRPPHEVAAQLRAGGLRRHRLGLEDLDVARHALHLAAALEQVEQAPAAGDVVVRQVQLSHTRVREVETVLGPVALDQPELDHPVDLPGHVVEVPALHGVQRAPPQVH